jgi:NADH-quinone oxidoreductase subunit C
MNESIKEKLESLFKNIRVDVPEDNRFIILAKKEVVLPVLNFLRGEGYDHLALISCVDWLKEEEFELVYILTPYPEEEHVILKTRITRENPEFKTIVHIFKNAEPYEREIHELFGLKFEGHPRLTPLFLERDYEIPPFRKDFDTREYVKEFFDKIPSVEEKK